MKSTNRQRIVLGLAVIAIGTLSIEKAARAQAPDVYYEQQVCPPGSDTYVVPSAAPYVTADPLYQTGVNFVPDTSPYMATGTVKGCEKCDEGPHTRCCLFNWLTYPFYCGGGKECACEWHHWCPRGHCKVKPTGCTRIDYAQYTVKGRKYKKSTASQESTAKTEDLDIALYQVYKPCCQNFWLEDGRLSPETDCGCDCDGSSGCSCGLCN